MINPDAGNLGAKVGFVFFGLGVPLCIAFYFLIPETRGLSFDEVFFPVLSRPRQHPCLESNWKAVFHWLTILNLVGLPLQQEGQLPPLSEYNQGAARGEWRYP